METAKDRLISFLDYLDIGQTKFEKYVGLSNGYVSKLKNAPSTDKARLIAAAYPSLNIIWLMTGEGEMLNYDANEEISQESVKPEISYTEGVPYYDEDFMLGFDEIYPTGYERPEYLIKMPGYERATLWCNASGGSMEPEISNGDIIALQRIENPSFLPFGDIYGFVTTNGMRTIKRLGKSKRDGFFRLIPTNKDYDEQEIHASEIAIVYRVMGAMKRF